MRQYRNRRDAHESAIVNALREAGATVQYLSVRGCPDLLIGIDGRNYLAEIKPPHGVLTYDEQVWHLNWTGQVAIVRSAAEALTLIGRA